MLRNMTPHKLTIYDDSGNILTEVPADDEQARVSEIITDEYVRHFDKFTVPVVVKGYGKANLPEPKHGVYLIVSKMVLDAHPDRADLLAPDTGPDSVVRDNGGKILGVRRLQATQ